MTEAVYNNNASQPPLQKVTVAPSSGQRSQDSWCQPDVSGYSDRSINETDFLGDVDYEWLCGYGRGPARASAPFGAKGGEPACEPLADPLYSELSYHVDATLAEVDMEEYYRGDINRILEISGYGDQEELYEEDEKEHSSPLFSSTREQPVFNTISMDSLDCSSYEPETIARSCRTNMNNYTIAFEASMTGSGMDHRREPSAVDNVPASGRCRMCHHSEGPLTTWSEQRARPAAAADVQSKSMPDALMNAPMSGSVLVYDVNQREASSSLVRLFLRQRPECGSSGGQSSSELLTGHSDSCSDCPMKSESESEAGGERPPARLSLLDPVPTAPYRPPRTAPAAGKIDSSSSDSSGRIRASRRDGVRLVPQRVDHSIQTSVSLAGAAERTSPSSGGRTSLYVCYPHYSMPNLQFLEQCPIQASVHLCPTPPPSAPTRTDAAVRRKTRRPYSCSDAETLRRANLSHIRDWGSLRLLLPRQFQQVVDELGYGSSEAGTASSAGRLHGGQCASASEAAARRHTVCPHTDAAPLTDSQRRGILRRGGAARCGACAADKRLSLQEPLQQWLHGAATFAASSARELERMSAAGTSARLSDSGEASRSKRVSFSDSHQEIEQEPSTGDGQDAKMRLVFGERSECVVKARTPSPSHPKRVIIVEKESFKGLLKPLIEAVNEIVAYFQSDSSSNKQDDSVGDSSVRPAGGYLVLDRLCPALYSILSHGLVTSLDTAFGEVPNSGWRLVESVTSLGTCPQALQDLVMKLNNEEGLSEGVLKFNAFIFGLLNTQSLDSWFSYLRTRESVVRKHYSPEALLYHANCAARAEYDTLLLQLQRLAQLSFRIDLLFESRMLYQSLGRLGRRLEGLAGSWSRAEGGARRRPRLGRPRSTVDAVDGGQETRTDKKRWSGLDLSSKLLQALDAILSESVANDNDNDRDDYDDDNELNEVDEEEEEDEDVEMEGEKPKPRTPPPPAAKTPPPSSEPKRKPAAASRLRAGAEAAPAPKSGLPTPRTNKDKFHKLQQQWEKMAKGQTPSSKRESRIPRPVSAGRTAAADGPVPRRPSQIPKPSSAAGGDASGTLRRRLGRCEPSAGAGGPASARLLSPKQEKDEENRAKGSSRASSAGARQRQRQRAAVEHDSSPADGKQPTKRVRSLAHYHASDRSYLSYNRHDAMSVVGVVDKDWLLCARNERVGLVARKNVLDVL
ncbi:uncharacterized protein LOC122367268 [Amphibalanus amphitrite]|uniref:uncharacterized protein LOC122367268 n=1 Tax=Amphibalanus amphitrite TaxID=1232801 RepID=UPI001C9118C8|nr:uncharacterized protein LOC122367268 [Amphibalanus amphitrite]